MSRDDYVITPICCGMIHGSEWSNLTLKRHIGEKIAVPSIIWLVRNAQHAVVVDAGPGDPVEVEALFGRALPRQEAPEQALARLGVPADSVRTVVLSHLHWDHSGGVAMFPNAEFLVHRQELDWAMAPLKVQAPLYEWQRNDGRPPRWLGARDRMRIIEEDCEIAPGLSLVHLPGHTPGCLGLCCATSAGRHLIACDAVPTYENVEEDVPPGWYVDLRDCYASLQRARDIADVILPSHDVRVLSQAHYPADPEGGAG